MSELFLFCFCNFPNRPNQFQFLLWNSAKYNISRINSGQQLSGRSSSAAASQNKSNVGTGRSSDPSSKKRFTRDVPIIFAGVDKQWTAAFSTFANFMNTTRTLSIFTVKNFSVTTVPALLIEVKSTLSMKLNLNCKYSLFVIVVGATGRERRPCPRGLSVHSGLQRQRLQVG